MLRNLARGPLRRLPAAMSPARRFTTQVTSVKSALPGPRPLTAFPEAVGLYDPKGAFQNMFRIEMNRHALICPELLCTQVILQLRHCNQ